MMEKVLRITYEANKNAFEKLWVHHRLF